MEKGEAKINKKKRLNSKAKRVQAVYKNGFTLVLAVIAAVILVMVGVGLLSLGFNSRLLAIRNGTVMAARCAADAGLTKAIFQMNEKLKVPPWDNSNLPSTPDGTFETLPNFDAVFSYQVASSNLGYAGQYYNVESVGRSGVSERTVYGLLRLRGVGEWGVLVRDKLILKAGTLVDGFDSSYPPNDQPEVHVQIGTASTSSDMIVLNNGVTVNGDVLVGYGGDLDTVIKDQGATVTGDKKSLREEPYFPSISPPPLFYMGEIDVKGENKTIYPEDSGKYTHIDLQQKAGVDASLVITGGNVILHITGDIDLGQGCEIIIENGATLNLYVDGDIKADNSIGFNNQGLPSDLKIWGNCDPDITQNWQLKAKSESFGQIYAPNAAITVNAKGDLYGSFTAYSFEMKSSGNLFYDGALRDVDQDDEGVRFVLKSWWE